MLRKALEKGERKAQRVIMRTKKGRSGIVARLLQARRPHESDTYWSTR